MRKNLSKILFFGPLSPPVTGQSIAFKEVFENLNDEKLLIDTTYFGKNKILNTLYSIISIFYYFTFYKFDYVYFTCSRTIMGFIKDYFLITLSSLYKIKIINHVHGADFKTFISVNSVFRKYILRAYNKVNVSIVLLDSMKKDFNIFKKMTVYTVSNSYSRTFDLIQDISKQELKILYFSNIMASKGIMEFLGSAEIILANNSKIKYIIAGAFLEDEISSEMKIRSEFYSKLNYLQQVYGIDRINYIGFISGKAKVEIFNESSIFVLPTYYKTEAFPITIIEAMRSGNAIISTNHNYIPEIIDSKNGILVETHSIEQLVKAQKDLINDPRLLKLIQKYNYEYSKLYYSPQQYIEKIRSIFINT